MKKCIRTIYSLFQKKVNNIRIYLFILVILNHTTFAEKKYYLKLDSNLQDILYSYFDWKMIQRW